ncbi:MAG: dihydrolipoyllysine-residue succinyltransferase [Chthoniobacterales bacterium]
MSNEVKVPSVGESVTSGVLSVWHKNDGEQVASGDILFTLETDKVSTEVTALENGVLSILVPEGEEVKVGEVVAKITEGAAKKEDAPKKDKDSDKEKPSTKAAAKPEVKKEAPPKKVETAPEPTPEPAPQKSIMAGPDDPRTTRKKLSPLRRKIATQLVAAQHSAAILTTFNECDMSEIMRIRKEMQPEFQKKNGIKLGFMSFFVKAVVDALHRIPSINSRMEGDYLVTNHYYDIGVAVGTERGLIVPVLRDCDSKNFAEIEQDLVNYAGKARDGKIGLEDLQGGVFTISNGGIYGSLMSTPILNPPQSGILGMHKIQERPMVIDGKIEIRPMMYLALSYDHRVVDGKEAVTFLIRVKDCLENPARMLLGT